MRPFVPSIMGATDMRQGLVFAGFSFRFKDLDVDLSERYEIDKAEKRR